MNTDKIQIFLRAVELGSLSKAAEELNYTPSALSHMMKSLENMLGITLVKRNSFGIELTKNGKKMLPYLKDAVMAEERLNAYALKLSKGKNRLRIGTFASISKYLLPEIIKDFKELYPDVRISIGVENDFRDCISTDKYDIIFCNNTDCHGWRRMDIKSDKFYVVSKRGTFEESKALNREDLYRYCFIMPVESLILSYFETSKFREIIRFNADDDTSVISMVEKGLGITVLPDLSINKSNPNISLNELNPELGRKIEVLYKSDEDSRMIKAFIKHLKKYKNNL